LARYVFEQTNKTLNEEEKQIVFFYLIATVRCCCFFIPIQLLLKEKYIE